MIRIKKYNNLKHKYLNKLFDYCINDYSIDMNVNTNEINFTEDLLIKSTDTYDIIKEQFLDMYILSFNDIIVIHLNERYIKDFEFLYKNSDKYLFEIYCNILPDIKGDGYSKMYHIFCISKDIDKLNYMNFTIMNDSDYKYACLSMFYNSYIIINRRFDIKSSIDKCNAKYSFIKTLGKGNVDVRLKNMVKSYVSLTNIYQDILPPHYVNIN